MQIYVVKGQRILMFGNAYLQALILILHFVVQFAEMSNINTCIP